MRIADFKERIIKGSLSKYIFQSSSWIFISTILSKGSLLVATILVAKYINKEVYGEFGIIKSTVNMFAVFGAMGLGATATKFIAQYKGSNVEKTANIITISNIFSLLFSLIISFAIVLFAKELASYVNAPHLENAIKFSSVMIFFSALNGVQTGILSGFENFRAISVNSVIAALLSSIMQICGAYYYGLIGVIVGFGMNYLFLFALNWFSIRGEMGTKYVTKLSSAFNLGELKVLLTFSLPAVLSGLMISPVIWYTNSLLVKGIKGYSEMAIFDIASQWRTTILFLPAILSQILFPIFSKNAENRLYHNRLFRISVMINFIAAAFCVLMLIPFTKFILSFYGDNYLNGSMTFIVTLSTTILVAVNNVIGQVIASKDRMWVGFITNLLWGTVLVISSFYFVTTREMGAIGLAISYLISYSFHTFIQYLVYYKYLNK